MIINQINIKDYDYDLPEERIAQHPVEKRDRSKLLIYNKGKITQDIFINIENYLPGDSLLVFNNARVISARLLFSKETGATIEILCLEPLLPPGYETVLSSESPVEWKCIIGNLKKWKKGIISIPFIKDEKEYILSASRVEPVGEAWRIRFSWLPEGLCFGEVLDAAGHIPLPPYIKREDEPEDHSRYQTIYSRVEGSVAAPTAGLHFTGNVLDNLEMRGIRSAELTLHVGAGTFKPVRHSNILNHEMHREHFSVSKDTIETIKNNEGRIISVGTTSVRTLESLYWLGVKYSGTGSTGKDNFHTDQWEPYLTKGSLSFRDSFESLLNLMNLRGISTLHASTGIMIVPGYDFKVISGIITNFHQPGSTLLLLIAAFTGENWKEIYNFASANGFRFLSYGDSSLIIK